MSLVARATVVQEALSWVGTPYHPHGRLKGIGVDCAMLPAEVYTAAGVIPAIDVEHYPIDWHLHRDEERYLRYVEPYASLTSTPLPGDLAVYRWGRCFAHGAIILQWPQIVHAVIDEGVTRALGDVGRLAGREVRFYTLWKEG